MWVSGHPWRWHPYKQAVTLVFRAFFPIFAVLDSTGMPSLGTPLRTTRKLLYMEKLMAALLLCAHSVRSHLSDTIYNCTNTYRQDHTHINWCFFSFAFPVTG